MDSNHSVIILSDTEPVTEDSIESIGQRMALDQALDQVDSESSSANVPLNLEASIIDLTSPPKRNPKRQKQTNNLSVGPERVASRNFPGALVGEKRPFAVDKTPVSLAAVRGFKAPQVSGVKAAFSSNTKENLIPSKKNKPTTSRLMDQSVICVSDLDLEFEITNESIPKTKLPPLKKIGEKKICEEQTSNTRNLISCPICLSDLDEIKSANGKMMSTPCGHLFCADCLKQAIKANLRCPQCRAKTQITKCHILHL
jgi:hypothetical protein